jgi:hypothetical protein
LLKAAIEIVKLIEYENASVLIHCSDGWDRTPQLTSLVQLMIDPFYRTIRGFEILIEKEWCSFGHRFATRSGHAPKKEIGNEEDERAPIFIQWLDCVWQLFTQFPAEFEFNEEFLIFIADALYSCQFGTFLCDSECERMEIRSKTVSVWTFVNLPENIIHFMNPFYKEKIFTSSLPSYTETMQLYLNAKRRASIDDGNVLWPSSSSKVVKLWEAYWLRWDPEFRIVAKTTENIKDYIYSLKKQNIELQRRLKQLTKMTLSERPTQSQELQKPPPPSSPHQDESHTQQQPQESQVQRHSNLEQKQLQPSQQQSETLSVLPLCQSVITVLDSEHKDKTTLTSSSVRIQPFRNEIQIGTHKSNANFPHQSLCLENNKNTEISCMDFKSHTQTQVSSDQKVLVNDQSSHHEQSDKTTEKMQKETTCNQTLS